jgi:hypothetical protein
MIENRSGKAQRDTPTPSKHQANVVSETLEPEENSRIPKIPGMDSQPVVAGPLGPGFVAEDN